jgi:hypothetical protein
VDQAPGTAVSKVLFTMPLMNRSISLHTFLGVDPMTWRTRNPSWLVSGLLVVTAVAAGLGVVAAQPERETGRAAFNTHEAAFELLGEHILVNLDNVAYASEEDGLIDVYFASSSRRGPDPLRLRDAGDKKMATSYFNDEKRCGRHFVKINKYRINLRNIAFIELKDNALIVNFSGKIMDSFMQIALSGLDAQNFRKKLGKF